MKEYEELLAHSLKEIVKGLMISVKAQDAELMITLAQVIDYIVNNLVKVMSVTIMEKK